MSSIEASRSNTKSDTLELHVIDIFSTREDVSCQSLHIAVSARQTISLHVLQTVEYGKIRSFEYGEIFLNYSAFRLVLRQQLRHQKYIYFLLRSQNLVRINLILSSMDESNSLQRITNKQRKRVKTVLHGIYM